MKFPWHRYEEIPVSRRNTLQIFITNMCNTRPSCTGCFARHVMEEGVIHNQRFIGLDEYRIAVCNAIQKGCKQINILGGEPMLHLELQHMLKYNQTCGLKTTIYTNGNKFNRYNQTDFHGAKLRVSIYSLDHDKAVYNIPEISVGFEANFMISKTTSVRDLLNAAEFVENHHNCKVFFIYDMRELDNPGQDFFVVTDNMTSTINYKRLVHEFLWYYKGRMDIHVSKRGVFESSVVLNADTKCHFANYFIGGKIIQCPWDVVNLKYQNDYEFGVRYCQHNSTCLMNKVVYRRKENG